MGRRKRLNVVRRSSKSQAKAELIGSSNDVNQKNHSINEECAQFGEFTRENAMVSSLNLQSTMGKHKRLNVVLRSGNSEAENQLIDNLIEVNQNNRSIKKDCAQFGGDTGKNAVVSSHKHQNTMGRRTRLNVVRSCHNSLTEQQLVDSSNHFNQNNPDIIEDYAQLRGDTGENATLSSFNHQNTIGRHQRLNAVRKNGKSQAKGQLVDSSNDVNQNNHSINEQCANFGRDTRDNAMISTLHQHTMERCKRLNIVRKSGVSQTKEQVVDNSNDVNQNNHGTKEVCANLGDTREIAMLSSLSHQNTTVRRKRSNASKKYGKSQAKEQFTDRSNDVNQNNYDTRENAMVSTVDHQNTIGRRTRSTAVGNSGKSLSKEQLIDSSNHFNQSNHDISKECAQLGGDTRENATLSNLNHQNTLGRCQRLNVVRKSGKSQAKEQLVDHSNDVNQNNHGVNELCANFGGDTREIAMTSRFNHQNTSVRRKKLSAAQNCGKSQAKEQIIESSNDINQNNHGIDEECAQFLANTRENAMVSTIDHQNTMGRRTRLTAVGNSGKSLSKEQLIYSSNHFNENNHDISEECAQLGGDTRENAMLSSFNCENISGRRQRMNVGRRSGKSQAEEQLVNRSKDVNQNNHSINELSANFGGDTREIAMPSSINHQNTSVRRKMLNAARKRGKSQANEQIIDNSNGVNQNNQSVNEECAQFGGDTRENVMVSSLNHQTKTVKRKRLNGFQKAGNSQAEKHVIDNEYNHEINVECAQFGGDTGENLLLSRLSRQNDQSCPEQQIQEGSHCEYYIPSGRTSISLPKGEKRVRGYTRMSDVWGIPDGEFILVEVDPLGNPIGVEGKKLLNAIGSLVRKHQYAPINYLSWKDMPELYIKNMLELIESKFLFAPKLTDQTKQILKDNMSSKWRQFKHDLKVKGYDESKTEEEMAANIPDTRVDPSQYRALVHHWCSQEAQKISNINKRNRSKYEDSHCMGTKNLPRFIHETIEANGVPPSRAQTYIETRTRKDGTIVTEKAANVIGELKKHMVEATSSHNPQTTQNSTNWENDIFAKVKGPEKRGRVRCLGMVARPANSNVSSTVEVKLHKLENLLGSLVSVLQTRFTEDRQINDVLQAIAQEVPNTLCSPNDSTSGNQ